MSGSLRLVRSCIGARKLELPFKLYLVSLIHVFPIQADPSAQGPANLNLAALIADFLHRLREVMIVGYGMSIIVRLKQLTSLHLQYFHDALEGWLDNLPKIGYAE